MIDQTGNTFYIVYCNWILFHYSNIHSYRFKLSLSLIHQLDCDTSADALLYCDLFHPLFPRSLKLQHWLLVTVRLQGVRIITRKSGYAARSILSWYYWRVPKSVKGCNA